jgi:hypothetical protein
VTSRHLPGVAVPGLLAAAGVLVVAGTATAAWSHSSSAASPANVVDRTFVCRTGAALGARTVDVDAHSGFRKGGKLEWFAQVSIRTPGQPVPRRENYEPTLAGIVAGWPPPPPFRSGSVGVSSVLCKPTRARVALTTRGLQGGKVTELLTGERVKCYAPESVLVRVRAAFFGPTRLRKNEDRTFLGATARMKMGQVAVRTPSGKRLVYAEVYDSGRARLFTAGSCF